MAGYIVLFVWSTILFIIITSIVFPKIFLKLKCSVTESGDRGIERIKGKDFTGIVYLPQASLLDKIDRYVIEEKGGKKLLRIKFTEKVRYVDYDVVAFSLSGETFDVLRVKEVLGNNGVSAPTELPDGTACISIRINETDLGPEKKPLTLNVTKKGKFFYCVFSVLAIIVEALAVKYCIANIFGGVFNESFMEGDTGPMTAIIIVVLSLICVISYSLTIKRRGKK